MRAMPSANAPWAKACGTCFGTPVQQGAMAAPWRTTQAGGAPAGLLAAQVQEDPEKASERKALGEQVRATKHALTSLEKLDPSAFPKARAALQRQLDTLA